MRRTRRRLNCLFYICTVIVCSAASSNYGVPIEINLWDTGRTPLTHMVDVTNGFGLKVLAEHNFLNDNNIAFSPYGLVGILVALYEGVDGDSSYQIQRGMQLPWNRNVMRIGFRDIHRTLKTYFVPEEGFLAGLALNNENVTFNEGYMKILRFYGFDLENDQIPTLPPQSNSTINNTTTMAPVTTDVPKNESKASAVDVTTEVTSTSLGENTSPPSREETTTNINAETLSDVDIRGPTPTTSENSSSTPMSQSTPVISSMLNNAEQVVLNSQATTTDRLEILTTTAMPITMTIPTTIAMSTTSTPTIMDETTNDAPTSSQSSATSVTVADEPTINNEVEIITNGEIVSSSVTVPVDTSTTSTTILSSEAAESTLSTMETIVTEQMSTTLTDITTETPPITNTNNTSLETLTRRKKSIVDFIFTKPAFEDEYLIHKLYGSGQDFPKFNFDGPEMFLVNGLRNVQVTYMQYDTILEYAYLPHLEASAIRLPLDSDRYYLLVVLPTRGVSSGLDRLLARMARESDLRDVHAALLPHRVRAVVPSFVVKGHITLTTDLQKLGIRDVFEPRQRDFTPMTSQSGVYVRSVEQAVSVAIRKYRPDDQSTNRHANAQQPVHFAATYPFLYFVMDSSIHVALMAGKMVDPLNTRIL